LNNGDGTFRSGATYPIGTDPGQVIEVASADLDGDGNPDLVVLNADFTTFVSGVQILLGNGDGTFRAGKFINTPALEPRPASVAITDLNGDGKLDLVLTYCCGESDAVYLLGNGDGTFRTEIHLPSGVAPAAVAVADLNADGKPDLIVADQGGFVVPLFNNLPTATAGPTITSNVSAASSTITSLAPASIATAFGSNLAAGTALAGSGTPPTTLSGTTLTITDSSGARSPAPLFYVSPTQVNYEVPANVATGVGQITITAGNGSQGTAAIQVSTVAPATFALNTGGLAAADVLVVNTDGSQTFQNVYQTDAANNLIPLPIDLTVGQVYLELFGTGIRNGKNVRVAVGGQQVPVLSAGSQGVFLGLDQVNIGPLPSLLRGAGQVGIVLTADGQTANTVNVTFR
jgi:uncharacterized protein (TIGR03437 family)